MPDNIDLLLSLALAIGLGLLVGLQREWEHNRVAGLRTFAFVSLSGALSAILALVFGDWVMGAALLAFGALTVSGYVASLRERNSDPGLTTAIAMLIMFVNGAITITGSHAMSVVIAGTVMVLLQEKKALHGIVHNIGEKELREIARLVLIGLVILPLLPNQAYGSNELLNPFAIWLMVVLIVGISLAAYLASKFLGDAKGTVIAGILGGLISSTATTVSVSRRSKMPESHPQPLAVITLIAGAVVFLRVIVEVAIVARSILWELLPPLATMMVFAILVSAAAYYLMLLGKTPTFEEPPPSELKNAVIFGLLYVLVLFAVSFAKDRFGQAGLYTVAAISGLTDMDAITLSTARLANSDHIESSTAWRVIMTGGLANILFKSALVISIGSRAYMKPVLFGFGVTIAGGVALIFLWP